MLIKQDKDNYIIVAVSIDDFLIAATITNLNDQFDSDLRSKYKTKSLGKPTSYLNWNISYTRDGIHISQPRHISQFAKYLNLSEATTQKTPFLDGTSTDPPVSGEKEDTKIGAYF